VGLNGVVVFVKDVESVGRFSITTINFTVLNFPALEKVINVGGDLFAGGGLVVDHEVANRGDCSKSQEGE